MAVRDDGWDSAWDDEDTMTGDDYARRSEHLQNAVWREREQRMRKMRANSQPNDYMLAKQRQAAEAEERRLAAIREAELARQRRNFTWSIAAFVVLVAVVLFLVL